MEEAVEICKLRLFLKLAAQVDPDSSHENLGIEPLPDIDFNIRAGNTLVGYASYDDVRHALTSTFDFENRMETISQKAGALQEAFDTFRIHQVEGDGSTTTKDKQELRRRLKALDGELNRYLVGEYKVDSSSEHAYARWLKSHQPFHWFVEFYGIMRRGGFDVIIGNPPYVEWRLVRDSYSLPNVNYASKEAGNLYALCMERSCHLLKSLGWYGMVVPIGLLGLDKAEMLRNILVERFSDNWFSTYAIRPSKLFEGVDQRLCICLETSSGLENHLHIRSTCYQHWNADERVTLFARTEYTHTSIHDRLKRVPQVGNSLADCVLRKLESKSRRPIAYYYSSNRQGFLLHYHRSPRYWIRAMDFEPHFKSPTRTRSVHHFRDIYFAEGSQGKFVGAVLNSSLFFFWFMVMGNGRNITGPDVGQFPIGHLADGSQTIPLVSEMFDRLMRNYDENSFIRVRQDCEYQEFRPSLSKAIINDIDHVLALHYGLTEEELDFIVNYDIKYRMGIDPEEERE